VTAAAETSIVNGDDDRYLPAVADLLSDYAAWIDVDLSFQGFEEELRSLPGAYARPAGRLLLALRADEPIGCVALRPLQPDVAEVKRLFVRPHSRGSGCGRQLMLRLLHDVKQIGYHRVCLDTLDRMASANHLYHTLGFKPVEAYYPNPLEGARFFALDLELWAGNVQEE
jgi:carbonic anhydrase